METLESTAIADVRRCVQSLNGVECFSAGAAFAGRVYTRDVALAGVLSLNRLFPQLMAQSLRVSRDHRQAAGFAVATGRPFPALPLPWEDSGLTQAQFVDRYHINTYDRGTDDVVWLWAAVDLMQHDESCGLTWDWILNIGTHFFDRFYEPLFDPSSGLYRGQVMFFDIPFDTSHTSGYPWSWSRDQVLQAYSLSTNCAYVLGLRSMYSAAKATGAPSPEQWLDRADRLADAIRSHMDPGDGLLRYLRSSDGPLQPHRDALGTAMCVLSGVVSDDQARRMIDTYPTASYGVPLLDPPRPDNDWAYHNRSAWPFVDAFFYWAADVAHQRNTAASAMQRLAATAFDGHTFREFVPAASGKPSGSASQLWSAAGYLNALIRMAAPRL